MSVLETHTLLLKEIAWIDANLSGITLPSDERTMLAVGCLDMTLEFQAAIASLYSSGLHGAMLALLRALTESMVRGLWLLHCATDAELLRFKEKGIKKEFGVLVQEVESKLQVSAPTLTNFKNFAYKALNDFTHTGFVQVSRRYGQDSVGANYPEKELKQALMIAMCFGAISASQLADLSDKPELAQTLLDRMSTFERKQPKT